MTTPSRRLPERPDLRHLKDEAKARVKAGEFAKISAAQFAIAREHGFASWSKLRTHIEQSVSQADVTTQDQERTEKLDAFVRAANAGHISTVTGLLARDPWMATADRQNSHGQLERQPALFRAAAMGKTKIIELLVGHGADVNVPWRDDYGTAMTAACECLNEAGPESVRVLLACGADPNLPHSDEPFDPRWPLRMVMSTYARSANKHACVEQLLAAGARHDQHPAVMAIHRGRVDLLDSAINGEPDVLHRCFDNVNYLWTPFDRPGPTLLHIADDSGEVELGRHLLERGADINARASMDGQGIGGHTPIFHTVASWSAMKPDGNALPFLKMLLARGAELNVQAAVSVETSAGVPWETRTLTPLGFARTFEDGLGYRNSKIAVDLLRSHGAAE